MTQEWREPVQEVRDVAFEARATANYARDAIPVLGRHLALLDKKVEEMGKDIAVIKSEALNIPNKVFTRIMVVFIPSMLAVISGLILILVQLQH